jgi:hypothetical protein
MGLDKATREVHNTFGNESQNLIRRSSRQERRGLIAQQVKELALQMRGLQNDIHIAGLEARESVHPMNEAHGRRA